MKIKIINPDYGMTEKQIEKRIKILNKFKRKDTHISMECLKDTEVVIDSLFESSIASKEIIEIARKAERDNYNAVVLYCFSDPALLPCRELLKIPVIGAGQSSLYTALELGYNFSLIITDKRRNPEKMNFIESNGISLSRLASIRKCSLDYDEIENDRNKTLKKLELAAKKCRDLDNAQVIVLGCLSFLDYGVELSEIINIPVIDSGINSLLTAERLYLQRLSHSKKSFPYPKNLL